MDGDRKGNNKYSIKNRLHRGDSNFHCFKIFNSYMRCKNFYNLKSDIGLVEAGRKR
jgi:hypothetical protein